MKSKVRKIFWLSTAVIFGILFLFVFTILGIYFCSDKISFDINKIKHSNLNIMIYDNQNRIVKNTDNSNNNIKLNTLKPHTLQAFISIEDKDFYSHKGLNYKRMAKAMLKNITSFRIKEGASTISQQLIKNTHLTNEKTFTRKINEIILTKKLEKTLSKNEILEHYLNIIYFGDNCYGIENASMHYFSKNAKDLSIAESATLAGMIKAPNTYSPTKNLTKTINRRNVVLNQMFQDNKITFNEYNTACSEKLNICIKPLQHNKLNTYYTSCIDEACSILNMPAKQISIGEYKIYSNLNTQKQLSLEKSLQAFDTNTDYAGISINPKNGSIEAYYAKSNIKLYNAKRQPGSAIKPIIVYAPALNENIINPLTQINDEEININGYTPNNIGSKYYGYISVRDCVSKSLNIPAVKVLSYIGINKAKNYATKSGITFDSKDDSLSLALGGMTYGTTLKELTNAYTILANNGKFIEAKFINYITNKDGKIIYRCNHNEIPVIREDSAYLMTDILRTCAKSGTGRKMGSLNFDIATKTGTVGKTKNTDAWNISYTTQDIVGIWLGNADNSPINTVGGAIPTDIAKTYLEEIYDESLPCDFIAPTSIYKEKIDIISLKDEHVVYKANNYIPEKYITYELFSKFNPPKEKSTKFLSCSPPILEGSVCNNIATLTFNSNDYLIYELYKIEDTKQELICVIANKKGLVSQDFVIDDKTKFYIITKIKNYADNTEIVSDKSNIIELIPNNLSNTKTYNKKT